MADQNGFGEWGGYMEAKMTKLEEQYSAASAPFRKSNLFAGISIYVNGLTNPSSDELKRIMMVHGGVYHHYQRAHTKFVIASNLPDVKVRNLNTSKIISAQWVVDCLKAHRILDYSPYLLYTNRKNTQPCLQFGESKSEQTFANKSQSEKVAQIVKELGILNAQIEKSYKLPKKEDDHRDIKSNVEFKPLKSVQPNTKVASNVARTAVDPNFLPEFFNNSRLHHIATLGAGFKQYVTELREKHDESLGFPARLKLQELLHGDTDVLIVEYVPTNRKYIMHIDMDCFFVSVGLRKHPHLRGQPVAVTHSKGGANASNVPVHPSANREVESELFAKRFEQHLHSNILSDKVRNGFDGKMSLSEIASCSYEAREKGVRNGMFVGEAIKLCPNLNTIPYDFEDYKKVANTLYDTIAQYTLQIEAVSCDEMFVDLTDVIDDLKVPPMVFVRFIRAEVREKTGCPCSAGIGANKLQARMATKCAKPDGQFHLQVNDVEGYMADILAADLPGVGSSISYHLKRAGYITCGDLQRLSLDRLQELVGKKHGETLYQFCRGIDNRPLTFEQIRKSVSAEVNYGIRFKKYDELETFLRQLCVEVHSRLCQIKRTTKSITLKVMVRAKEAPVETSKFMGHGVCDNITKSISLSHFTNDIDVITRSVLKTMKNLNLPPHELRGIGIQLTKLDDPKLSHDPKENVLKNMFTKLSEKRKGEDKALVVKPTSNDIVSKIQKDVPGYIEMYKSPELKKNVTEKKRANVFGMLQEADVKKQKLSDTSSTKASKLVLPNYIDAEVFEALPQNIREEILNDLLEDKNSVLLEKPPSPQIPSSSAFSVPLLSAPLEITSVPFVDLDEQPSTSRAAFERRAMQRNKEKENMHQNIPDVYRFNLKRQNETDISENKNADKVYKLAKQSSFLTLSKNNIFLQPNCKRLLLEWVKSDIEPEEYDVNLCCEHAREMIRANQVDDLYSSLTFLRKVIRAKHSFVSNNEWFKVYGHIMDSVNQEMNLVHNGRKLLTRDTILS